MFAGGDKLLFEKAGAMRSQPTFAEELLWTYLKTKPLGFKFRRQHVYAVYIFDFYCHALQLTIEVDGSIHDLEEVKQTDKERQQQLENCGLKMLRFTNNEIRLHLQDVQKKIENYILENSLPTKKAYPT